MGHTKKIKIKIGNECRTVKVCIPDGPTGPTGVIGPTGPTGLIGPTGPDISPTSIFASFVKQTTQSFVGFPTNITFPIQSAVNGVVSNSPTNDTFTVQPGTYDIEYEVTIFGSTGVAGIVSQLSINGVPDLDSVNTLTIPSAATPIRLPMLFRIFKVFGAVTTISVTVDSNSVGTFSCTNGSIAILKIA